MTRRATGKSYGNTERKISHAESTMIRQNYYWPLFRRSWTPLTCDYEIRIRQRSRIKFHEKNQRRHTIFHSPLFFIRPLNWPFQLSFDICNTIVCFLLAFEYLFNDSIISIGRFILLKKKKKEEGKDYKTLLYRVRYEETFRKSIKEFKELVFTGLSHVCRGAYVMTTIWESFTSGKTRWKARALMILGG